jgi:hypothetical protein
MQTTYELLVGKTLFYQEENVSHEATFDANLNTSTS